MPGHEIVERIEAIGARIQGLNMGERVGIPWLGQTCGICPYLIGGQKWALSPRLQCIRSTKQTRRWPICALVGSRARRCLCPEHGSHWSFGSCSGFTPWRPQDFQVMLLHMDNKKWLIEAEFAACLVAAAIVAFTLMVGHTMWRSMARN
jgi:hypothetical protein